MVTEECELRMTVIDIFVEISEFSDFVGRLVEGSELNVILVVWLLRKVSLE